jgi:hypothetical protein
VAADRREQQDGSVSFPLRFVTSGRDDLAPPDAGGPARDAVHGGGTEDQMPLYARLGQGAGIRTAVDDVATAAEPAA